MMLAVNIFLFLGGIFPVIASHGIPLILIPGILMFVAAGLMAPGYFNCEPQLLGAPGTLREI